MFSFLGDKFNLLNNEFCSLCHLVYSKRETPKGEDGVPNKTKSILEVEPLMSIRETLKWTKIKPSG